MDDIHGCGVEELVDEHLEELKTRLTLKRGEKCTSGTYTHLKRTRVLRPEGRYLQASSAHVKEVARRLGLEKAKSLPTPEIEALRPTPYAEMLPPLDSEQATEYRSLTCTLLYAGQDIVEAQHAIRTLTTDLKRPTEASWSRLKRVTRYLLGVMNEAIFFQWVEVRIAT